MTTESELVFDTNGLLERIDQALIAGGADPQNPALEKIGQIDEIHIRGPFITAELIPLLNVQPGSRVLDVGSGIGGPARHIAIETGATVLGVDQKAGAVDVARTLTERMGMSGKVSFVYSEIENLDPSHRDFDAAIAIHVGMNIADKSGFYSAIHDRIRPGATLIIYDILASGNGSPITYPSPWAVDESQSFLSTPDQMTNFLKNAGFSDIVYADDTQASIDFMNGVMKRAQEEGPNPLSLGAVFGPVFREMMQSQGANFKTGAIKIGQFSCVRP